MSIKRMSILAERFFVQLRYVIQHACIESIVTGTLAEIKGHHSKNPLTPK